MGDCCCSCCCCCASWRTRSATNRPWRQWTTRNSSQSAKSLCKFKSPENRFKKKVFDKFKHIFNCTFQSNHAKIFFWNVKIKNSDSEWLSATCVSLPKIKDLGWNRKIQNKFSELIWTRTQAKRKRKLKNSNSCLRAF